MQPTCHSDSLLLKVMFCPSRAWVYLMLLVEVESRRRRNGEPVQKVGRRSGFVRFLRLMRARLSGIRVVLAKVKGVIAATRDVTASYACAGCACTAVDERRGRENGKVRDC